MIHRPYVIRSFFDWSFFLLLPLFLISIGSVAYSAGDFEVERQTEFRVGEKEGKYTLESKVTETLTYLSDRSVARRAFFVSEPFYATLSGLYGIHSRGKLGSDHISYDYIEHEDVFIADNKVWQVEFPSQKKGESVTYGYEMKYEGAEWFPVLYVLNTGRVRKFAVTIKHPADVEVEFNMFFPREEFPFSLEKGEGKTELIFENIAERKDLNYFPFNGFNAAVQVRLTRNGRGITPTTLAEFTAWYQGLFDQKPTIAPSQAAKVKEAMAGAATPREKLKAIHDYVRTGIRYIAEEDDYGAIVPRNPELVLQRGYGDCKDRAYLISALAAAEGIDVDMTLVATRPTPTFSDHVYLSQFNHAICSWEDGDRRVYFDPTSKYTEFDNLPYGDLESAALVLDPESPRMLRLPRPNMNPAIEVELRGSLEDPENARARVTLRNVYFSAAMQALNDLRGLELENRLSNMVTSHFYKISLDYFERDSVGEDFVIFNARADISDFLIASTTKKYLPVIPFRSIEADILDRKEDRWPITTDVKETLELRMILDIDGYLVEKTSFAFGDDRLASFSSSINLTEDGRALVDYRFRQVSGLYEGDAREGYLDFCREYLKSKKQMFILPSATE